MDGISLISRRSHYPRTRKNESTGTHIYQTNSNDSLLSISLAFVLPIFRQNSTYPILPNLDRWWNL